MKKLRILFVAEHYPPHVGGVETFFFELRKRLVARGHHVDVITSGNSPVEHDEGGAIYRVGGGQHSFTFLSIPTVLKLAKRADIIHTTMYNAAVPAWIGAKIHGKRSVLSVHEVLGPDFAHVFKGRALKARIFEFLERALLCLNFDHTVAVSKATQKKLKRKSSVIYHGIDSSFNEARVEHEGFEFLYFGRIAANKGIWFLLESLKEFYVNGGRTKFKLLLSGNVADFAKVEKLISGISNFVTIKRSISRADLPAEIAAADAVVVPSLAEGFCFSAAEAMAMDVPVILSDAGSLPEIAGGKHLIFKSGDKTALIEAMNKAVNGEWNECEKKNFSWDKAADEFEELYRSLL